ncbi:helix-turn-helix transcriptional regulator [bacterium]|nr:helix-turn-helix transcriptional regulator [bacterium]
MNFKKAFGEKLKRLRKARGYTQEQLAELIEIDPRNLSRIEVGTSFVKGETLAKILKTLDVTTEQLFSNDHIKPSEELLSDIQKYLDMAKMNQSKLEKIHKMIRFIVFDE